MNRAFVIAIAILAIVIAGIILYFGLSNRAQQKNPREQSSVSVKAKVTAAPSEFVTKEIPESEQWKFVAELTDTVTFKNETHNVSIFENSTDASRFVEGWANLPSDVAMPGVGERYFIQGNEMFPLRDRSTGLQRFFVIRFLGVVP